MEEPDAAGSVEPEKAHLELGRIGYRDEDGARLGECLPIDEVRAV
jgi:hypothetical protein